MTNKVRKPRQSEQRTPTRAEMEADINRILDRLDVEIPEAQKRMDELLRSLRSMRTRTAA